VLFFLLALMLICLVASAVIFAFAWPHLRAGSPLLTPRGERLVGRLRPVARVTGPVVRGVGRPVVQLLAPPARAAGRRLGPSLQSVLRALEEGAGSRPAVRPVTVPGALLLPSAPAVMVSPAPAPAAPPALAVPPLTAWTPVEPAPAVEGAPVEPAPAVEGRLEYVIQPFRPHGHRRAGRSPATRR